MPNTIIGIHGLVNKPEREVPALSCAPEKPHHPELTWEPLAMGAM